MSRQLQGRLGAWAAEMGKRAPPWTQSARRFTVQMCACQHLNTRRTALTSYASLSRMQMLWPASPMKSGWHSLHVLRYARLISSNGASSSTCQANAEGGGWVQPGRSIDGPNARPGLLR